MQLRAETAKDLVLALRLRSLCLGLGTPHPKMRCAPVRLSGFCLFFVGSVEMQGEKVTNQGQPSPFFLRIFFFFFTLALSLGRS